MHLVEAQPMKMSATEAHWETENPAGLSLFAIIDEDKQENSFEVKVPKLLSFMSYGSFTGEVKGIKELQAEAEKAYGPGNYIPPVTSLFWAFRIMVGVGTLLVLVVFLALYFYKTKRLEKNSWFLKVLIWIIPLPYIANTTGWFMAESGRQPWIVYGLQKTSAGISTAVSTGSILTTLIGFTLIYGALALAEVYLLIKFIRRGPEVTEHSEAAEDIAKGASLWT
jgi:cytochrome d ubiquinol oxidase subunit I